MHCPSWLIAAVELFHPAMYVLGLSHLGKHACLVVESATKVSLSVTKEEL